MQKYNLLFILNKNETQLLTLYRLKDPYKGLYNLPGGKVDEGETVLKSAYRELEEETGITSKDVTLSPFIDYTWHPVNVKMYVFIGKLHGDKILQDEVHPLFWQPLANNFFDQSVYAGEGNIGHMVEIYKQTRKTLDL